MPRIRRSVFTVGLVGAVAAVLATSAFALGTLSASKPKGPKNPNRSVVDVRTEAEQKYNMPFEPGIMSSGGKLLWFGGSNALPLYHEHPHDPKVVKAIPKSAYKQSAIALHEIERTLEGGCATWSDVVRMDIFASSKDAFYGYIKASSEIVGPYFPQDPTRGWPTGVFSYVKALGEPEEKIEISGVAVVPSGRSC